MSMKPKKPPDPPKPHLFSSLLFSSFSLPFCLCSYLLNLEFDALCDTQLKTSLPSILLCSVGRCSRARCPVCAAFMGIFASLGICSNLVNPLWPLRPLRGPPLPPSPEDWQILFVSFHCRHMVFRSEFQVTCSISFPAQPRALCCHRLDWKKSILQTAMVQFGFLFCWMLFKISLLLEKLSPDEFFRTKYSTSNGLATNFLRLTQIESRMSLNWSNVLLFLCLYFSWNLYMSDAIVPSYMCLCKLSISDDLSHAPLAYVVVPCCCCQRHVSPQPQPWLSLVFNHVLATCDYVKDVDFKGRFLIPCLLPDIESLDYQASCALYLNLVLIWAYFYDGLRLYWPGDMGLFYAHLYVLLRHCLCNFSCMSLLFLFLCLLRGNVEIPSRHFPRPSLSRLQNTPFLVQHGFHMSCVKIDIFMVSYTIKYPLVPCQWIVYTEQALESFPVLYGHVNGNAPGFGARIGVDPSLGEPPIPCIPRCCCSWSLRSMMHSLSTETLCISRRLRFWCSFLITLVRITVFILNMMSRHTNCEIQGHRELNGPFKQQNLIGNYLLALHSRVYNIYDIVSWDNCIWFTRELPWYHTYLLAECAAKFSPGYVSPNKAIPIMGIHIHGEQHNGQFQWNIWGLSYEKARLC